MKLAYRVLPIVLLLGQGCATLPPESEQSSEFQLGEDLKLSFVEIVLKPDEREACKDNTAPCLNNGSIAFGAEGSPPTTYLKRLTLHTKSQSYELESRHMYNALLGKPAEVAGIIQYLYAECRAVDSCTVRGIFSDAGASYVAEWQIIEGQPIRTILTASQDVVAAFQKSLAPPRFD